MSTVTGAEGRSFTYLMGLDGFGGSSDLLTERRGCDLLETNACEKSSIGLGDSGTG